MVDNFQKLSDHIDEQLSNAHSHVALDLADTSGAFALIELEKILKNMEPALRQLKILDNNEKLLRFIGSIHRDCWRGIKRDLVFFMVTLCQLDKCINEMRRYMRLDTSHCLHVDDMPNTTVFVEAMEGAIDGHLIDVVSKAIQRFNMIQDLIRKAIEPIKPPLSLILRRAASNLHDEYAYLNDLIDAVISDIHLRNMRSADTFDDINERFGTNRLTFDSIACALLFLILFALILGLCFGLCTRKSRAGSKFLIFAIILILCAFTFITLMGLFYFVLGMVTYQSVCRRLGELGDYESKSMRPVDRLGACKPDQHMYDFLAEYKLYDVERILYEDNKGPIDVDDVRWIPWDGDLSKFKILTMEEVELINKTLFDAYRYNGKLYTDNVCKDLRTPSKSIASDWYRFLYNNLYVMDIGCLEFQAVCTSVNSLMIDARNAQKLEPEILRCIDAITELTTKLDALLLGKKFNFGATITHLFDKILQSEEFIKASGKQYINTLGRNLTESLKTRINEYRLYTQSRIQNGVGPCGPLIYHLDRGTKSACRQLIDPINGFWMGLLMSSLIYLPLLFVAHYLICLYRPYKVKWPVVYLVRNDGCPTCTGHPYVPPPVVICTGGQENDWDSIDIDTVESKSKDD
ncbi:hypothetical protein KR044_000929 [Drosophila immigrans]|nr:hypothetical protein KR044_000929 [Drosophila immigrans]